MSKWGEMAQLYADNQEWKHKYEQQLKKKKEKEMKHTYEREIYMSEYVTVPKSRLRRLILTEVIAWGIVAFVLIVTVLR